MTTGERIRQARKSAGMTQAELAHKLGISAAGIAQWENDLRNPKIETLRKLADALGVTPGYLLYGDTDPVQRSLFDAEDTASRRSGRKPACSHIFWQMPPSICSGVLRIVLVRHLLAENHFFPAHIRNCFYSFVRCLCSAGCASPLSAARAGCCPSGVPVSVCRRSPVHG